MADPEERPPPPRPPLIFEPKFDGLLTKGPREPKNLGGGGKPPPPLNSRSGSGTVFLKLRNILVFFVGLFISLCVCVCVCVCWGGGGEYFLDLSMSGPHTRSTIKKKHYFSFFFCKILKGDGGG